MKKKNLASFLKFAVYRNYTSHLKALRTHVTKLYYTLQWTSHLIHFRNQTKQCGWPIVVNAGPAISPPNYFSTYSTNDKSSLVRVSSWRQTGSEHLNPMDLLLFLGGSLM